MRTFVLAVLPWIVSVAHAQPEASHPGYPPTVLLASATEEGGKVVLRISRPGPVSPDVDGQLAPGERFETEWVPLRKMTLGESVAAFGADGQPLTPAAVLKFLDEPRGVAVFMRSYTNDPPTPPAFYRDLFKPETVFVIVRGDDLDNPRP